MLPRIFRTLLYPLITFRGTYLVGMVLVRSARYFRSKFFKKEKQFVTISNFMGNVKMKIDKNSYMGGSIYWCGFHHINELLYLKSFLNKDMTFVDVGANQGEFSLYACSRLSKGKVIAFEPTSFQLGLLKENVLLNDFKNIEINDFGLLDKEDKLEVYTSYETDLHSGYHEGLSTLYKSEDRKEIEEVIELKVFDPLYLERLDRIDFVKIDIEGAELFALKGMKGSLQKFRPQVIVELNKETFNNAGYEVKDVLDFFTAIEYVPYKLFRGRKYHAEIVDNSLEYGNYLFLPIEQSN